MRPKAITGRIQNPKLKMKQKHQNIKSDSGQFS